MRWENHQEAAQLKTRGSYAWDQGQNAKQDLVVNTTVLVCF